MSASCHALIKQHKRYANRDISYWMRCIIRLIMVETVPRAHTDTLTVVTWNILLDRIHGPVVKPQGDRVESQAKRLMELGKSLDVVMLQEVEGHSGDRIAELTGNQPGIWARHSRKNEHIGAFGERVKSADFYDLGYGKKAVAVQVGGIALFGVHLLARPKRYFERNAEVRRLCEVVDLQDRAVIAGDLNGPRWEGARRMLARRGFRSVFTEIGESRPGTFPTADYREITWSRKQRALVPWMINIDDILVRGVGVQDAGLIEGDSDHAGLWADLAT